MSPLAKSTIATVGSGVMAEAMIAGMLRGKLVEPGQVVASHPRQERREHLAREYGIRTVASNTEAVEGADVILFGIKPQMLAKVGREIGPHLRRGQLVLSVLAGATTAALIGTLGHDQVVREHAEHAGPPRQGDDRLVRDARDDRRRSAPRLPPCSARSATQLEVDDEKMVAMATAVSGTGPTYVFLVMEALIDAAVHLGFPRHIAHDLVIETLEGSHRSSPSSRGCTRPSCATWSRRPAGPRPRRSTSSSRAGSGRSCRRRSGPPTGGPSSSATSSRQSVAPAPKRRR